MEILELKHISPYLPYGVKVEDHSEAIANELEKLYGKKEIPISYQEAIKRANLVGVKVFDLVTYAILQAYPEGEDVYLDYRVPIKYIKPILRPLSDLVKEIEVNREKFIPICELAKIHYESPKCHTKRAYINESNSAVGEIAYRNSVTCYTISLENNYVLEKSYNIVQKLLEWHFDVFGLIQKGLAVDINNTIEKQ